MHRRFCFLVVSGLFLSLSVGTAWSFVPVEYPRGGAILQPGHETPPVWRTVGLEPDRHPEAVDFEARYGGVWSYQWNPWTGTPHAVFGSGTQVSTARLVDEGQVEQVARRFVEENRGLLRVEREELEVRSIVNGSGKWGVIFDQVYGGLKVEGSRLRLLMTEEGRLYYFGSDWHPGISVSVQPVLGLPVARELAGREVGYLAGRDIDHGGGLSILPVPEGEGIGYRLVWRTRLELVDPYAIWETCVDAQDGRIWWRYDDVHYVNVVGTTAGDVEDFGYCYGEADRVLPNMQVRVTGGNTGYSDLGGNYDISHGGSTPVEVTAQLDGRWINVNNQAGADASFSGMATPGVPFEIRWSDANAQDDERDAYLHGNRIHDLIKQYEPGWGPPDYRMSANVSLNSTCNAYWNGTSINFYRAGGGCGNTGQMGDVIYHEYGHGITQWIYGTNPNDVGEGNSDIAAMFIDGNSIVGEGFYLNNCASGIRNADNNLRYPDDYQAGQIHFNGQIVSGFWWDAREILLPILGEQGTLDLLWPNWHFGRRTLQPISMPDQVLTAFLMDDDNGDLTDGTPHYYAFCPAAEHHGFDPPGPAPAVTITHTRLHNQTYDGNPDVVTATITSTEGAIDPGAVELRYQVNGGSVTAVAMVPTGNPNEFAGTIPALPVGVFVDYSMVARDVHGNPGSYPTSNCSPDTPAGSVRFYVATFVDEVEFDIGWTVNPDGDDDATTGVWELIDPRGTAAQPEDDQTPPPGVNAWITGQCAPGCGLGDNDIDGGKTTLLSPLFDLTGSTTAKIVYYRWYSNDTGATPGTDYWVVDATNDGGASWLNVENTNESLSAWTPIEVDLNPLFGGPAELVQIRYIASDEGDGSLVEAGVDEFMIFVDFETDAPEEIVAGIVPRFALFPARPNPFRNGTDIAFEIPVPATVRISIHDVGGRSIRTLSEGRSFAAGRHALAWDGTDQAGRSVATGIYYVRLRTEGFSANRKIVMQK